MAVSALCWDKTLLGYWFCFYKNIIQKFTMTHIKILKKLKPNHLKPLYRALMRIKVRVLIRVWARVFVWACRNIVRKFTKAIQI